MKRYGLPAGSLCHKLTFQKLQKTEDSFGKESIEEWVNAFTAYAAYEVVGSREFPTSAKRFAETTARFKVRYRPNLDSAEYRIQFFFDPDHQIEPQIFNIYPPEPLNGWRGGWVIEASEIR